MVKFIFENNFFEFNSKTKQQVSGTALGTKFAPPYVCIFMDKVETEVLYKELLKVWVWLRYIDDIFFVWTLEKESLHKFLKHFNNFSEISVQKVNFLDVTVKLQEN